jgi:TonB family protein
MSSPLDLFSNPVDKEYQDRNVAGMVALGVSVGIHAGVLLVALPSLSSLAPEQQPNKNPISVIQLTRAEQSRLPNLEQSPLNLPQETNTSVLPSPPADSFDLTRSLPGSINTVTPPPALPPLPSNYNPISPGYNISIPPNISVNSLRTTVPPQASLPPSPPVLPTLEAPRPYTENLPPGGIQRPVFPDSQAQLSPDDLRRAPITQGQNRQNEMTPWGQSPLAVNRTGQTLSPSTIAANAIREERLRRVAREIYENAEALREDKNNTTDQDYQINAARWRVEKAAGSKKDELEYSISGTYPGLACSRKLEGSAIYGASVTAGGQATGLSLLRSSGYPILNQQAERDILSKSYPNTTGSQKPLTIKVNFNYNPQNCSSTRTNPAKTEGEQTVQPPSQPNPETAITTPPNSKKPSEANPAPVTPKATPETAITVPPAPKKNPEANPVPVTPKATPEAAITVPPAPKKNPEVKPDPEAAITVPPVPKENPEVKPDPEAAITVPPAPKKNPEANPTQEETQPEPEISP